MKVRELLGDHAMGGYEIVEKNFRQFYTYGEIITVLNLTVMGDESGDAEYIQVAFPDGYVLFQGIEFGL